MSYSMSSEFVTQGHPDRVADAIAARIIQEIQQTDGEHSHAAIEVMLANNHCIIGGEATTSLDLKKEAPRLISEALCACGYTKEYRNKFNEEECWVDGDYTIDVTVNRQSPDIALGVGHDKGFNDQGVFCSSAEAFAPNKMGLSHAIAKYLGDCLFNYALTSDWMGVDIKTLVTVQYLNYKKPINITAITVAVPTVSTGEDEDHLRQIEGLIKEILENSVYSSYVDFATIDLVINGTGAYHIHGSMGDTGVTGRKLAVNCNSLYSPIGGGALVKPAHASDLLLFLASRHIAKAVIDLGKHTTCQVQLSCAIGQKELQSLRIILDDSDGSSSEELKLAAAIPEYFTWSPAGFAKLWGTYKLPFMETANTNFIGSNLSAAQPWENTEGLVKYLKQKGF